MLMPHQGRQESPSKMKQLRVMAVDDEDMAIRRLDLALKTIPGAELVAKAYSGRDAAESLAAARPDVILLDVEMANGSGTAFAEQLRGPSAPAVVFVTAYEDYAVEAFRLQAVDYVLKPVKFERLALALERVRKHLRLSQADREAAALHGHLMAKQAPGGDSGGMDHCLWVWNGREQLRVSQVRIDWLEAERDYVRVHVGCRSYLMRGPLSAVEARLLPGTFLRVRRSAVVRLDGIRALRRPTAIDRRLVLASGAEVRLGKTYVAAVQQLLKVS
jgi:DNA-binding LytR/AlgR family response regulator